MCVRWGICNTSIAAAIHELSLWSAIARICARRSASSGFNGRSGALWVTRLCVMGLGTVQPGREESIGETISDAAHLETNRFIPPSSHSPAVEVIDRDKDTCPRRIWRMTHFLVAPRVIRY